MDYRLHISKEFPSEKELKLYLKEHPNADEDAHSVVESGGTGQKIKDAIKGIGSKILGVLKDEAAEWKAAGRGLKKLVSGEKLEPEEKRQLINYTIHQAMILGTKAAIFSIVPPPPGYAVKQAISTVAFRLIDKKLGQRFGLQPAKTARDVEKELSKLIEECLEEAMAQELEKHEKKEKKSASIVAARYLQLA